MVERFYGPLTGFEMRPGERGDYVRYSDYVALEAQLAEARKALDALGDFAFWFQKYPELKPNPDMQAEMLADLDRARPFIPARRALEAQGGE